MNLEKKSLQAGVLYFALILPGIFAFLLIPDTILSKTNPTDYILNNLWIIFVWIVLDILIILIEIVLTIYLKQLFDPYSKQLSRIAFWSRMVMVMVMVVNLLFLLILFTNQDNAVDFVRRHLDGTYIWQFFFSLHVFLLGYMMAQHLKTIWQYLGYILILGSFGYLFDSIQYFFIHDSAFFGTMVSFLLIFVTFGEIGMAFALVRKKILIH